MKWIKTAALAVLIILSAAIVVSDASAPAIVAANQAAVNQSQDEVNQTSGVIQVSTPQNAEQPKKPGFEAVFAIAGLFAVAYLVLRQRK